MHTFFIGRDYTVSDSWFVLHLVSPFNLKSAIIYVFFYKQNPNQTATRTPRRPKPPQIGSRGVIRSVCIVGGEECPVLWFRGVIRTTVIVRGEGGNSYFFLIFKIYLHHCTLHKICDKTRSMLNILKYFINLKVIYLNCRSNLAMQQK